MKLGRWYPDRTAFFLFAKIEDDTPPFAGAKVIVLEPAATLKVAV